MFNGNKNVVHIILPFSEQFVCSSVCLLENLEVCSCLSVVVLFYLIFKAFAEFDIFSFSISE